ncbi:hypothetical protein ACV7F3_000450 [Campylobacter jejuni]|nr:hypothetical protein [Campylobacter jejuni]EJS3352099.1 hypothetical protein [Campylobacter jejuni]EKJ1373972.1 hypothetical protein [Campylobacter jejuni]
MSFTPYNDNLKILKHFQNELDYIFNKRFKFFDYEIFSTLNDKLKYFVEKEMFKDEVLYLIKELEQEKRLFLHSKGKFIKDYQKRQRLIDLCLSVNNKLVSKIENMKI